MSDPVRRPPAEPELDWEAARARMRRRIAAALRESDPATLDDLAQEALVRLLRALRREGARQPEALMVEIARRTAIDHIRAQVRWRAFRASLQQHLGDEGRAPASPDGAFGDPLANLRFLVLEFFRQKGSPCGTFAKAYFEEQDWEAVAKRIGRTHAAVRQQWSRCLAVLREAVRRDPDFPWRPAPDGREDGDA